MSTKEHMNNKTDHKELFICQCDDIEHQMIFRYDDDPDWDTVYATIHLCPEYHWYMRVWHAIKYVFGYKCRYGDFDEFLFKPEDWEKMQKITNYLKECYDRRDKQLAGNQFRGNYTEG